MGLDISYHGGVTGSSGAGVKKEYVDAYNKHKSTIRRRGNNNNNNVNSSHQGAPTWLSSGISEAGRSTSDGSDPDREGPSAAP